MKKIRRPSPLSLAIAASFGASDTPSNEVPQSISVISADQISDQNAQTRQEVLRYTAGVRSEMYGLDNRGDCWFGTQRKAVLSVGYRW